MSRLLLLLFVCCLAIPACQCSDKPEIGPVEGGEAALSVARPVNRA
jgi:hypothetical protein